MSNRADANNAADCVTLLQTAGVSIEVARGLATEVGTGKAARAYLEGVLETLGDLHLCLGEMRDDIRRRLNG